ncbi:MAG: metal-dependent hydrolase [Bacillus sp. (in: firmicutes)]
MMYKTHIITSLAAGAGVAAHGHYSFTITYALGVAIGSVLPDLDQPKSFIGQRSFGLAVIISKLFGHRGFMHSLLAWALLTGFCLLFNSAFAMGISLGYLFHIIGDFFSVSSVPLFKPFTNYRPRNMWFSYKNKSAAEEVIKYVAMTVLVYYFLIQKLYEPFFYSIVADSTQLVRLMIG